MLLFLGNPSSLRARIQPVPLTDLFSLAHYMPHSRCSERICWMNKWFICSFFPQNFLVSETSAYYYVHKKELSNCLYPHSIWQGISRSLAWLCSPLDWWLLKIRCLVHLLSVTLILLAQGLWLTFIQNPVSCQYYTRHWVTGGEP